MPLLESYLVTVAALNWLGIAGLVLYDARRRDVRNGWQWGALGLATGIFGFAVYVLLVVAPPERRELRR